MANTKSTRRQRDPPDTRALGVAASLVGLGLLSLYPLAAAGVAPGGRPLPYYGLPESIHPFVVFCSAVAGPVFLTWGALAVRHRTASPLTPRRTLIAPLVSVLGIAAGVAWFTYEWVRATPFVWGATEPTTMDPTVLELVQREVGTAQFVALAAVTAMVVGAVAARCGRRKAVASALVPAALFVVAVVLGPRTLPELLFGLGLVLVLSVVPFTIGYAATNPE